MCSVDWEGGCLTAAPARRHPPPAMGLLGYVGWDERGLYVMLNFWALCFEYIDWRCGLDTLD